MRTEYNLNIFMNEENIIKVIVTTASTPGEGIYTYLIQPSALVKYTQETQPQFSETLHILLWIFFKIGLIWFILGWLNGRLLEHRTLSILNLDHAFIKHSWSYSLTNGSKPALSSEIKSYIMKRSQLQLCSTPYWLGNIRLVQGQNLSPLWAKKSDDILQAQRNKTTTTKVTRGCLNLISWSVSAQEIPNTLEI